MASRKIEAHELCIHGPSARAYLGSHLCWQDRIGKEVNADIYAQKLGGAASSNRSPVDTKATRAYYPIGGRHNLNNDSSKAQRALGPLTWSASGGIKSTYGAATGTAKGLNIPGQLLPEDSFVRRPPQPKGMPPKAKSEALLSSDLAEIQRQGVSQRQDIHRLAKATHTNGLMQVSVDEVLRNGPPSAPQLETQSNAGSHRSHASSGHKPRSISSHHGVTQPSHHHHHGSHSGHHHHHRHGKHPTRAYTDAQFDHLDTHHHDHEPILTPGMKEEIREIHDFATEAHREAKRLAALNQLEAVHMVDQDELLRLANMSPEEMKALKQKGDGATLALAQGLKAGLDGKAPQKPVF
mmetsp:Transcript_17692/g.41019  ORF Transcript_17692/g.41019 Transcript_17692/m.41019 type:complete len:352 (+) Transcript_17692:90-1145(+)